MVDVAVIMADLIEQLFSINKIYCFGKNNKSEIIIIILMCVELPLKDISRNIHNLFVGTLTRVKVEIQRSKTEMIQCYKCKFFDYNHSNCHFAR